MSDTTRAWFHDLTESVFAVGAGAREYRMAHQAAQSAAWSFESARLDSVEGAVSVVGRYFIQPHHETLRNLKEIHDSTEVRIKALYENTSLAYAYGTAHAVADIARGQRPRHLEFARRDGFYGIPAAPLPNLEVVLARWPGGPNLIALGEILTEHIRARDLARDFSFYEDFADCHSPESAEASKFAAGLADAAYAYGEVAERALHFVVLGLQKNHVTQESK
ncbi:MULTISPECIES: hypothetical protein [Streptomyces]|uniref:hypothetical protein n=1 Tax=Streptomyces TaxID=1883 RepID=UPI001E466AD0|nr:MULTISPECIES: hypothetical protein [Streptomyces]UFQ16879.1 hypothetical protein J2N69_18785 [Streptomyces huasconensis]WCL86482.1 hypothetical protein PPN52_18790 [Streptomyces sp. JCM 35825]